MIVTCPSCSSRYKIKADKITGRGAKITCPKCQHKFVVYNDGAEQEQKSRVPDNVAEYDFRTLGLTWRVRRTDGQTHDFWSLSSLQEMLESNQVTQDSAITFDNRDWSQISALDDLALFFFQTWEKAKRGEIIIAAPEVSEEDDEDEDAADAPTTLIGQGSHLSGELADLIAGLETPAAPQNRQEAPDAIVVDQTGKPTSPREVSNLSTHFVEPADLPTADRPAPIDTGAPAKPRTYAPPEQTEDEESKPAPEDSGPSKVVLTGVIVGLIATIILLAIILAGNAQPSASPDESPASSPSTPPVEQPAEPEAAPANEPSEAAPPEPTAPSGGG